MAESFKDRVKEVAINGAEKYRRNYIEKEYLLFSEELLNKYYVVTGNKENYLHLIDVHTNLTAKEFFDKCEAKILDVSDFDFTDKKGNNMKGTVRRKIKVLDNMLDLMQQKEIYLQENFSKNNIICTIGTTDNVCTVGFIKVGKKENSKTIPKTLLKDNVLKNEKKISLILKKQKGDKKFNEIQLGNKELIQKNYKYINHMLDNSLFEGNERENFMN